MLNLPCTLASTVRSNDSDHNPFSWLETSHTGSTSAQLLAMQWLSRCQNNEDGQHDECNRCGGAWLPTRLIDVRCALATSVLRLRSQTKTPDALIADQRYITPCHCWGKWGPEGIPILNMANEHDRSQKGIALEQVPSTFQQALIVADWFDGQ